MKRILFKYKGGCRALYLYVAAMSSYEARAEDRSWQNETHVYAVRPKWTTIWAWHPMYNLKALEYTFREH